MKKSKKIILTLLAFIVIAAGVSAQKVEAATVTSVKVPTVSKVSAMDSLTACYTQKANVSKDKTVRTYAKFTLSSDSWVKFTGNYSLSNNDYGSTHVDIYSDSAFSNKRAEYGWGYWQYTKEYVGFLKKGTYYMTVYTELGNGQSFEGNVNVIAGAIPVSKVINTSVQAGKKKGQSFFSWE